MLSDARNYKQSTVLFESAQRLADLFISIEKVYGSLQQVWIGFELTKLFEKKLRGECRELYEELHNPKLHKHLKGEVILIIAPYTRDYNINLVEETPKVETEYNQKIDMINAA